MSPLLSDNEDYDDDNNLLFLLEKQRQSVNFETISNAHTIDNSEENPGRGNQLRSGRIEEVRYELLTNAITNNLENHGTENEDIEPREEDFYNSEDDFNTSIETIQSIEHLNRNLLTPIQIRYLDRHVIGGAR